VAGRWSGFWPKALDETAEGGFFLSNCGFQKFRDLSHRSESSVERFGGSSAQSQRSSSLDGRRLRTSLVCSVIVLAALDSAAARRSNPSACASVRTVNGMQSLGTYVTKTMSNLLQSEARGSTAVEHLPRHDHAWAVSANNGSVGKVLACATAKKLPVTIWTNRHRLLEHSLLTWSRRLQRSIRATKNPSCRP
jgi:hypothetical protein